MVAATGQGGLPLDSSAPTQPPTATAVTTLGCARATAAEWVARHACGQPWFRGAYLVGSTVGAPDAAALPLGSDVDILVVRAEAQPPPKPGKFLYHGVLLEVSFVPGPELASVEAVLASHHLAHGLRAGTILHDPGGTLRALQEEVAARFAQPAWVHRRLVTVGRAGEAWLRAIDRTAPWHAQVQAWLFGTGASAHVVLVAALRNPTVRLRYLRAREVLAESGHAEFYPELLALLGCADLPAHRVARHVDALARTFDAAAAALRTPYRFASDIAPAARPIAIDASRALIARGDHREAVFFVVATFARCHSILAVDAPDTLRALAPAFDELLGDLGLACTDDLLRRAAAVRRFLPTLWATASALRGAHGSPPAW